MKNIEIVSFLGETFSEVSGSFCSMPPNAKFLQMTFGTENVKVISPSKQAFEQRFTPNSIVHSSNFYKAPLPAGCTTKEFYKRSIFKRGFAYAHALIPLLLGQFGLIGLFLYLSVLAYLSYKAGFFGWLLFLVIMLSGLSLADPWQILNYFVFLIIGHARRLDTRGIKYERN